MQSAAVGNIVDACRDDVVERHGVAGDNATTPRRFDALVASDCGTWGRARDEQNGAHLR